MYFYLLIYEFRSMINTIIGDPNKAVTALIGRVPCIPGSWEIKSQTNSVMAPQSMEAGRMMRWLGLPNKPRAT